MATKYSFEFDPQYSNQMFSLLIECELKNTGKTELNLLLRVYDQDGERPKEIDLKSLDLRDRAMIWDKAWTESDKFHTTTLERG